LVLLYHDRYISRLSDMQVSCMNRDNITVEFEHIVFVVQIDRHFSHFPVEASKFLDDAQWGEDEKTFGAHQHEWCHNEVGRQEKNSRKNIFAYPVFEPAKAECFGEKDMLQIAHVSGRKEKDVIVESEQVVLFDPEFSLVSKLLENPVD